MYLAHWTSRAKVCWAGAALVQMTWHTVLKGMVNSCHSCHLVFTSGGNGDFVVLKGGV